MNLYRRFSFVIVFCLVLSLGGLQVFSNTTGNSQNIYAQEFSQQEDRPNILMIMGDDFSYADIGAFGSSISTPNLDALANEGKILTNYHTVPACSPARVAALTGVDHHIGGIGSMFELIAPNQVGQPGYETYINDKVVTVQELLRDAGYHTYHSGKWHLSGHHVENGTLPYERGFEKSFTLVGGGANHFNHTEPPIEDVIFAENGEIIPRPGNKTLYSNDMYADRMIEYLKNNTDGKPFFGYLSFQVAHSPFQTPEGSIDKYEGIFSMGWDELRKQNFEKQKELGFWPENMTLPDRIPPNQPWSELTQEQKDYATRIMASHAAMIENMDSAIGRVIQVLKDSGQYDNTLIIFTSDNGSAEPAPLLHIPFDTRDNEAMDNYLKTVNNSLSNIGNVSSIVNYGAWGSFSTISPLSGYKLTQYEGGTRVPFVIKEPIGSENITSNSSSSSPNPQMSKAFTFVNDLTPTILDYAGIQHPGTTYDGRIIHPMMGKSLKPLLNGTTDMIYAERDIVADELFNQTAVYMGDWKATKHMPPVGNGEWQLHNIVTDPGQNNDVSAEHPEILDQMIAGYETYAQEVAVIPPKGEKFYNVMAVTVPPLNQSQVTITSNDISPAQFSNETQLSIGENMSQFPLKVENMSQFPILQELWRLLHS